MHQIQVDEHRMTIPHKRVDVSWHLRMYSIDRVFILDGRAMRVVDVNEEEKALAAGRATRRVAKRMFSDSTRRGGCLACGLAMMLFECSVCVGVRSNSTIMVVIRQFVSAE